MVQENGKVGVGSIFRLEGSAIWRRHQPENMDLTPTGMQAKSEGEPTRKVYRKNRHKQGLSVVHIDDRQGVATTDHRIARVNACRDQVIVVGENVVGSRRGLRVGHELDVPILE